MTAHARGDGGPDVLALIHQDNAGPGHFTSAVAAAGHRLEVASFALDRLPERPITEYAAVIIFGGSAQVDEEDSLPWLRREKQALGEALTGGVPILGICLGGQLLAEAAGARVGPARVPRRGWNDVQLTPEAADDPIFAGLARTLRTVVWHKYEFALPPGATPLARSSTALQGFRCAGRPAWGLQFHPEVTHAGLLEWLDMMATSGELDEADARRFASESETMETQQRELGSRICRSFLAAGRSLRQSA